MALDLVRDAEGNVVGVTALEMETGEVIPGQATILATSGTAIFTASTNAFINTGDGLGMAARRAPLEHGISGNYPQVSPPALITEGGRGGILLNADGERFMERYALNLKDLGRAIVSRSMDQEIKEGRGCGLIRTTCC
jgi:succinate dehydrogenase / fumarate reductase flavoprotein subunit